jgi:predicted RNase H-like HicB family nuclease
MKKRLLNYRIIIEKEAYEDGSIVYVAYCPTLGLSDYGDSVEDVLESIKDGIELAVETLVKEGREFPLDHIEDQIIASVKINAPSGLKLSVA